MNRDEALPPEVAREVVARPGAIDIEMQASKALGIDRTVANGFTQHAGENRRTRRAAVATWAPPEGAPSRRALLEQRQKRARGTLDTGLRRLQKAKLKR